MPGHQVKTIYYYHCIYYSRQLAKLPVFVFYMLPVKKLTAYSGLYNGRGNLIFAFTLLSSISSMLYHFDLQTKGFAGRRQLASLVKDRAIQFAGNRKLKIYGTLACSSGKRMKTINRVFFASEQEALDHGYRPCGHCRRNQYLLWKENK